MLSGDGLLVRVRFSCGEVAPDLAADVADCAQTHGNGLIDLSARGNLQIRGVSEATWAPLIERLAALGLIDPSSEAEAVRNVQVSPFAGFFPDAPDVRPLARALETMLAEEPALWRLPGKFGFSIDAGPIPLGEVSADVAFADAGQGAYELRVAGEEIVLGPLAADRVVAVARSIAHLFLGCREGRAQPPRRLRDLVGEIGVEALSAHLDVPLGRRSPIPLAPALVDILGFHERAGRAFLGVGLPFGRMSARDLKAFAELAARAGAPSLRLTPWRAILALGADADLLQAVRELDVILESDDPRLAVVACPGAPECASSSVRTREIAQRLAPLAVRLAETGPALHVSGCQKGCAHPRSARATVVGNAGRFDLVLDGKAGDAPTTSGLDSEGLARSVAAISRSRPS